MHALAWKALREGTEVAKAEGLYGAGQDLLKDAFTGNLHGLGPQVAEMEFTERPAEPFMVLAADKTEPGAPGPPPPTHPGAGGRDLPGPGRPGLLRGLWGGGLGAA